MPDDPGLGPIDDPLTAAGDLGRTARPSPPESEVRGPAARSRQGRLVPVGALAAAILAAGVLGLTTDRTPAQSASAPVTPVIVPAGRAELIVRDGDLVEASGSVEDAELCAPAPVAGDTCPHGIQVPRIGTTDGTTLRGRWHPGWLTDIQRMPYAPTSAGTHGDAELPDTPPCPAPAGGWRDGEDWVDDQVRAHLHAHADRFAQPFATHVGNARILVVEVVGGDVDQARAALTAIYTDNLCVVAAPGGHSIAAENRLQATTGEAIGALMNDPTSGIYLAGSENGKIRVNMVQLTQPLYDRLAAIGLDHLILDPWIRPVGP